MDILFSRAHSPTEPWLVHAELTLDGHLDDARLAGALTQVDRRHPMLRAVPCDRDSRHWQVHEEPRSTLSLEVLADAAVDDRRDAILGKTIDLDDQVLRVHVLRDTERDRLVGVAHHAAVDGMAVHRALLDLGLAYSGGSLTVETSWELAHEMRVADIPRTIIDDVVNSVREATRRKPVRVAPGRPSGETGVGAIVAPLGTPAPVEVLVGALSRALGEWNRERDRAASPLLVGVPLSLRSPDRWSDGLCNASIVWPVVADPDQDDRELLGAARSQLSSVRLGRRSRSVRGFLAALPATGRLPLWAERTMMCTTICSATKGLGDADFGPGAPRVVSGWGTPPVSAFGGCAFGARLDEGACWISARYLKAWFSSASVADILERVCHAYVSLSRASQREPEE